jgi:hypothetical protein
MGLRDIGKRLRASVDELDNVRLQGRFVGKELLPIEGLPILDGYKCMQCIYYVFKSEAIRKHVRSHEWEEGTDRWERCTVQSPFGGRFKKCFGVSDRLVRAAEDSGENAAWTVLSAKLGRKRARLSTVKEDDLRFVSSFVARTRWDILVEDHDWKKLKEKSITPELYRLRRNQKT